jgi:hypothetical protein
MAGDQASQEATETDPVYYVLPDAVQRATDILDRAQRAGII